MKREKYSQCLFWIPSALVISAKHINTTSAAQYVNVVVKKLWMNNLYAKYAWKFINWLKRNHTKIIQNVTEV